MKRLHPFFIAIRNNAFALLLFMLLWSGCALFFPAYIIPTPLDVFRHIETYLEAEFPAHLAVTLYRVLVSFVLAFSIGTGLGILAALWKKQEHLSTLMVLFQVIPGTILGIIFLLVFGVGHAVPIALMTFLTFPVIAINTANGLLRKNLLLEQYVRSIGGRRSHLIRSVYVPALIPIFQSNLTIGFGLSLKIVILGEFIGSQEGIGYLLNLSKLYFNMQAVFFYLFVVVAIMVCFQIFQHVVFATFLGKYFYPE